MTYDERLEYFRVTLERKLADYNMEKYPGLALPNVQIFYGRSYDKVVLYKGGSRSVYCFVNKKTGGLLKGNWKKVEDKRERGNIFNDNPLQGCNPYGLDYLKMANYSF